MRSNLNIEEIEEKIEDLQIQLEVAKAEELVYDALKYFEYTVGKNTKAYFDRETDEIVCVYDTSGKDFNYDDEDGDPYIEFSFDPYDILEMPACDILIHFKEDADIIEAIENECNKWFYLTIEKES